MKNAILELTHLVRQVSLVDDPCDQVKLIVDSISELIGIDVCSLYRSNDDGDMVLLASHGLAVTSALTVPAGKGLVGLVSQSRHPINVAEAASHPNYFYVPETREERYSSFFGAPLVRRGEVIGVLVVQGVRPQMLGEEAEALLVTLASQLALIVANIPDTGKPVSAINRQVLGIKGAPGVGIGAVYIGSGGDLAAVPDADCDDIDVSIQQWHQLLHSTRDDLSHEQASLGAEISGSVGGIFEAYQMLLSDQSLIGRVEAEIRAGQWLPGALRAGIHYYAELFQAMEDPYLRARHEDIRHLGNKLFSVWQGVSRVDQARELPSGPLVLVAAQVSISDIAGIPLQQLAGIVCYEGSSLSHVAVLANAMGIPAVMGMGTLPGLHAGDPLIVDGNVGQVFLNPSAALINEFRYLILQDQQRRQQLDELRELPAITSDGEVVSLLTNTGLLADLSPGINSGAEGIGLYRTEIPFMIRDSFPSEDEQVHVYSTVLASYAGKPVYMRTLDVGGDKQLPYFPIHAEENPALGWRGIRFTLDNIQLLMTQVRAMIRAAAGADNLHILLPMISSTSEVDSFKVLLEDALTQLRQEGVEVCRPRVGVMIEVPAAISQLPFWRDKIDFISIGSNDLSQYLLALDRNNARVASRYDHVHPAVLHEIYRIVNSARQCQLPVSLCGEMAADPVAVVLLLGMGIRSLSLSAAKLPGIKSLIRSLSIASACDLLEQALQMDCVADIRGLVDDALA